MIIGSPTKAFTIRIMDKGKPKNLKAINCAVEILVTFNLEYICFRHKIEATDNPNLC